MLMFRASLTTDNASIVTRLDRHGSLYVAPPPPPTQAKTSSIAPAACKQLTERAKSRNCQTQEVRAALENCKQAGRASSFDLLGKPCCIRPIEQRCTWPTVTP